MYATLIELKAMSVTGPRAATAAPVGTAERRGCRYGQDGRLDHAREKQDGVCLDAAAVAVLVGA